MNKKQTLILVVKDQNGTREVTLHGNGPWIIGRGDTPEVGLAENRCSRKHAQLRLERNLLIAEDLKSTNGTLLDGASITRPQKISKDSVIAIGEARIQLKKSALPASGKTSSDSPAKVDSGRKRTSENVRKSKRNQSTPVGSIFLLLGAVITTGWLLISTFGQSPEPTQTEDSSSSLVRNEPSNSEDPGEVKFSIPTPQPLEVVSEKPAPVKEADGEIIEQRRSSFDPDSSFDADLDQFHDAGDSEERQSDAQVVQRNGDSAEDDQLQFLILDEAWPPSDRIIAFDIHLKDPHGATDFVV